MKTLNKFVFLFVFLFVAFVANDSKANAILYKIYNGVYNIKIDLPFPPFTQDHNVTFAGTILGAVDGDTTTFYCIDMQHNARVNNPYTDSASAKDKIIYILTHYYPNIPHPYPGAMASLKKEAGAVQFAIWHFSDNLDLNTIDSSDLRTRALQIAADAEANWTLNAFVKNIEILQLSSSGNPTDVDTLQVIVRNFNGAGLPNITVNLSASDGTLNTSSVVTGPDGKSPKFFLTKGADSVAKLTACASGIPISIGTLYKELSAPYKYQKVATAEKCYGDKCDIMVINWNCSGGGGGGVESNYNMAEVLFQRFMKIRSGETTKLISNNNPVFPLQWILQDFIPANGPFNSARIETTPFDILGISNATSAYACDYLVNNSRVGVVFSTTTNPPEIYSHQKQTCDRLVYGSLDELKFTTIDNKQFYYGKILRPELGYVDNAVSFSVYQTSSGFVVDNKWTLDEYVVPGNAINVYNFQVWAPMLNSTKAIVKGIIDKFRLIGNVTYTSGQLKTADIYVQDAFYINNGSLYVNFRNYSNQNQAVNMQIVYMKQQGGQEQTINQIVNVDANGSEFYFPVGLISSARIYFTTQSGFKDAIFIGSGIYSYLTGPNSTITLHSTIQSQTIPTYPFGAFVFPGGMRVKGTLNDEITITRSFDPAMRGIDLTGFDRLKFNAAGTGKVKLFLEVISGTERLYPYIELELNGEKTYEIPLRTFKVDGKSVNLSRVTYAGWAMLKDFNQGISQTDFTISNVTLYSNNDVASSLTPGSYKLYQNYPNPFNPVTYIKFDIPKATKVQIKIYDLLGREISTLLDADMQPATGYEVAFDASKLASGVYFYRLITKDAVLSQKMVLLK